MRMTEALELTAAGSIWRDTGNEQRDLLVAREDPGELEGTYVDVLRDQLRRRDIGQR